MCAWLYIKIYMRANFSAFRVKGTAAILDFILKIMVSKTYIVSHFLACNLSDRILSITIIILGVKTNFCYFSSLITFYYIHEW